MTFTTVPLFLRAVALLARWIHERSAEQSPQGLKAGRFAGDYVRAKQAAKKLNAEGTGGRYGLLKETADLSTALPRISC